MSRVARHFCRISHVGYFEVMGCPIKLCMEANLWWSIGYTMVEAIFGP